MWNPKSEGLNELLNLFSISKGNDNQKQKEVYYKINDYSKNAEFSNYLLYILNDEIVEVDIRQISGLTLKSILEREFNNLSDNSIEYFKSNILNHYLHQNSKIRKTISILLNTFLRQGGIEIWPELLEFLYENLDNEKCAETSLETLNFVFEDSGSNLERKFDKFIQKYVHKLLKSLETSSNNLERNETLVKLVLTSIEILIENCSNLMIDLIQNIINVLLTLHLVKNLNIRYKTGRCWMTIIRIKPETLIVYFDNLYGFFLDNLTVEYYELNFNAAEFLVLIIEEDNNNFVKYENIYSKIRNNLKILINHLIHYMNLTHNDLSGMENTFKQCSQYVSKMENYITVVEDFKQPDEFASESYNPNTTLRKLCARTLDKLSTLFPADVFQIVKESLERDMKNHDWIIREKSILTLGAISKGSYDYLKQHLSNLCQFLITELQNPNKPIRAISCWTISRYFFFSSRFSNFILIDNLSENANELFKNCLGEILKRIMDTESMVQEAACSTFSNFITVKKEKLEPYIHDIFQVYIFYEKVITSIFDKYKGNSMLNLYDIISYMTEEFSDYFKNKEIAEPLLKCAINKWNNTNNQDFNNLIPSLEILCSLLKVSGNLISPYCEEFFQRSLKIIEEIISNFQLHNNDFNYLEKDLISKCIDFISVLCITHGECLNNSINKSKLIELLLTLITINDYELKHYVFALIGDLTKSHPTILKNYLDDLLIILTHHLECPANLNKYDTVEISKLHVCNNTCWTIGLFAIAFQEHIGKYIEAIMIKLLKIFCVTRLNKSLAQNVSICIGRLAMAYPEKISKFIDSFLKQFCLSLRVINNSKEKQEAFTGLCQSILYNPNGVINHFAYFCDAICNYDNAPSELNNIFHKLLHSYKSSLSEKWMNYFQNFPTKLQKKMINRFKIE